MRDASRFFNADRRWKRTLMEGCRTLSKKFGTAQADTPHLPRVSCHGLQMVKRWETPDNFVSD